MSLWQSKTPGCKFLSEEFLRGIAMKSEDGNKFEYFPVEKLSKQEKSRFRQIGCRAASKSISSVPPVSWLCKAIIDISHESQ